MRRDIVVLGFFIIVLIVIAGCTSIQSAATTESKNQNSGLGDTNVKTTSASSYTSSSECKLQPMDPILFQKFFPNVPGWTRKYSGTDKYDRGIFRGNSFNNEVYSLSDKSNPSVRVIVGFGDRGPCVTESTGLNWQINNEKIGEFDGFITSKINDFHGYPAIYKISNVSNQYREGYVIIGIKNRYYVSIGTTGEEYSISEAEANLEKFGNVIDFRGLAASV